MQSRFHTIHEWTERRDFVLSAAAAASLHWLVQWLDVGTLSVGHFSLDISPLGHIPRTFPPPFLHGVGHFPLPPPPCANLHHVHIKKVPLIFFAVTFKNIDRFS